MRPKTSTAPGLFGRTNSSTDSGHISGSHWDHLSISKRMNAHIPSPDAHVYFLTLLLTSVLKNQLPGREKGTDSWDRSVQPCPFWSIHECLRGVGSSTKSGFLRLLWRFLNFDDLLLDGYTSRVVTSS